VTGLYYPAGTFRSRLGTARGPYLELRVTVEISHAGDGQRWSLTMEPDGLCTMAHHPNGFKMRGGAISVNLWDEGLPTGERRGHWAFPAEVDEMKSVILFEAPWAERPPRTITFLPSRTVEENVQRVKWERRPTARAKPLERAKPIEPVVPVIRTVSDALHPAVIVQSDILLPATGPAILPPPLPAVPPPLSHQWRRWFISKAALLVVGVVGGCRNLVATLGRLVRPT